MATERKQAKYPRVYPKHGAWYWVDPTSGRWIRLCALKDDETTLVARLAEERKKRERPEGSGDMRPLIDRYVRENKHLRKEKAWPKYGQYAGNGFRKANVADVKPAHVNKWLTVKYAGKLHMQRVMRAFLSGFFQWCIDNGLRDTNPCREVRIKKPKPRQTYIPDAHFAAIRDAMLQVTYERNGKEITADVPTGPRMQCFIDLCYLTAQRSTEIRNLKWSDVDRQAGVIHFVPSKTEDSSGVRVDFLITPEIDAVLTRIREIDGRPTIGDVYVFRPKNGKRYAANTILKAWKTAADRAGLAGFRYTIKDIRAKALTDGERAGYNVKALQVAAAHTDAKMTETYIKQRATPVANVRLQVPKSA
ncbi:tyrosine-type recombinase/integrase [Burkholderia multivorans]|uniref:tyrosine-type recombinase/integrase n=1 Tax=Burkholderia multivorans TaxID=87883 RepID=UPI0028572E00|nr:tyrosine-type recombinase/integrase [Burkholderia multivorans]MDR8920494.1 Tyrosine recombinase XerC [Burkholderia multivorans]MDR8921899.1 Tyrosine recombinase XerC [Burkholderia multivorans]MDR8988556.1 Tyrosine recombinase XerC [Burkholderia multivorans]MDR9019555.1 Tyrosine recombinase XerC [Burkholderia multivorans]MDR9029736.1 Tyrosine recombinase XerC [Burkholderia multivorans]